jgi:hypothetical protein
MKRTKGDILAVRAFDQWADALLCADGWRAALRAGGRLRPAHGAGCTVRVYTRHARADGYDVPVWVIVVRRAAPKGGA